MHPGRLPMEVFQALPAGRGPEADSGTGREILSLHWPGNASGSFKQSWLMSSLFWRQKVPGQRRGPAERKRGRRDYSPGKNSWKNVKKKKRKKEKIINTCFWPVSKMFLCIFFLWSIFYWQNIEEGNPGKIVDCRTQKEKEKKFLQEQTGQQTGLIFAHYHELKKPSRSLNFPRVAFFKWIGSTKRVTNKTFILFYS